jgi:hypothetical protein
MRRCCAAIKCRGLRLQLPGRADIAPVLPEHGSDQPIDVDRKMVGVARIELATPAMSTQETTSRTTDFCQYHPFENANRPRI